MRLAFFILLLVMSLTVPWQAFMIGVFLYVFLYEGLEVLLIGFLLDAFAGHSVPWLPVTAVYTIAMTGMLIFVWGMKPLFLIESRM